MPVYKYSLQDGKSKWGFVTYYENWTGERKQKRCTGFLTQREAKQAEIDFLNSCKNDVEITFGNLTTRYMEDCRTRMAETTFENKKSLIYSKLIPYFGRMPLNEITVLTVRQWQNEMINHPDHFKQTYLKSMHNQLSAILNFAVKYFGLPFNPAARCGSMGKKDAEEMNFWTIDEFKKVAEAASEDPQTLTMLRLLYYSGMREGEMLALSLDDFNGENGTVSIEKNFAVVNGKPLIKEPKTPNSKRIVALPKEIIDEVKQYADQLYDYHSSDRLFVVGKSSLSRRMEKYSKIAGVKRIRVHDLRHSHASLLIELGISPLVISERLGHKDIRTTLNTYGHLYPHKQQEVVNMLSGVL